MVHRLPTPGGDDGSWGDVLNDFLLQGLNSDGMVKNAGVVADKYTKPGTGIPATDLDSATQSAITRASTVNTILHGTGIPSNSLGNDGDFYIDTASVSYDMYIKVSGAWT